MVNRALQVILAIIAVVSVQCRTASKTEDRVLVDFSMVEKALDWLELVKSESDDAVVKDFFMHEVAPTSGCKSIIRHWRRFMKWDNNEFFRFIMEALGRVESDHLARDEKGDLTPYGRRQAFWQDAINDPDRIRHDLEALKKADLVDTALSLARKYLPEEAIVRSKFFIVLFGGSSAYAVGDVNGFDLLQLPKQRNGSIDVESVIRTFAHEMHHTGIRFIQKRHMSGVHHKNRLGLVARLVNEGIPIYYINQTKKRLSILANSPNPTRQADVRDWKRHLARLPELYIEAERDIRLNLKGEIKDEEIMANWMAGSQGQAYVLGAEMISVIDSQLGLEAVLNVACDYRQLLSVYNQAAKIANRSGLNRFLFDDELASHLAKFTGRE